MIQGTINRDFLQMPGGELNIAVGAAYRFESVNQPSANPDDAYYGINAVSTAGSRRVYSGFYEVTAPILPILKLKADGRYDSYSSGQSNFSPKFEASSSRSRQLKIRGTFSKGFKIPSFSQSYGLPTTGYSDDHLRAQTRPTGVLRGACQQPTYYGGTAMAAAATRWA
jgi:iron complex outermembrane receptor protein